MRTVQSRPPEIASRSWSSLASTLRNSTLSLCCPVMGKPPDSPFVGSHFHVRSVPSHPPVMYSSPREPTHETSSLCACVASSSTRATRNEGGVLPPPPHAPPRLELSRRRKACDGVSSPSSRSSTTRCSTEGIVACFDVVALVDALGGVRGRLVRFAPSTSLADGDLDDASVAVCRADKISSNSSTAARSLATRASVCRTLREL
mmetsp:Transcript_2636/g.10194  ORF Transcript_2636/g.10194 Transcript_2636/m.10194 type:complete len:204 (+) Transcript_2636:959-1570(+)